MSLTLQNIASATANLDTTLAAFNETLPTLQSAAEDIAGFAANLDDLGASFISHKHEDLTASAVARAALSALEAQSPRAARVVELRYFAGLTIEETADSLEVSQSTIDRQWRAARAWLQREISSAE